VFSHTRALGQRLARQTGACPTTAEDVGVERSDAPLCVAGLTVETQLFRGSVSASILVFMEELPCNSQYSRRRLCRRIRLRLCRLWHRRRALCPRPAKAPLRQPGFLFPTAQTLPGS
jgi:hypothetical protein